MKKPLILLTAAALTVSLIPAAASAANIGTLQVIELDMRGDEMMTLPCRGGAVLVKSEYTSYGDEWEGGTTISTYTCDNAGRITSESWNQYGETESITFSYNSDGNLTKWSDGLFTYSYSYDKDGRLTKHTFTENSTGITETLGTFSNYDSNSNPQTETSFGEQSRLTYDAAGNLVSYDDYMTYTYDQYGNMLTLKFGDEIMQKNTYTYDKYGNVLTKNISYGGGGTDAIITYTYRYPGPKVVLSTQNLSVNGTTVDCEKYNIDGSNYFKLRDLAYLLRDTDSRFSVGYDSTSNTVTITTGEVYTPNGSELVTGADKSATAKASRQSILIDGKEVSGLSVYNIGGNNYFKLRDLGEALGFDVGYDNATKTATVNG